MKKILVLHGVNLNMFGKRDPSHYGTTTLAEINEMMVGLGKDLGYLVECFQTNSEADMVSRIHQAHEERIAAVIINAGAWTHYSYGISDALGILEVPVVEVHMSHVHAREEFRHHSVFSNVVQGQISGFGMNSYHLGLLAVDGLLKDEK